MASNTTCAAAGRLDHDVGTEPRATGSTDLAVVGGAEVLRPTSGLGPSVTRSSDVDLQSALHAEQRGEQPDRARPGDQDRARLEPGPRADPLDLVPCLGHHAGGLHQHADPGEGRVDFDRVAGPTRHHWLA